MGRGPAARSLPSAASDKNIPFITPSELLAEKRPSLLHELIRVRGRRHKQFTRSLHMPRHSGATGAHEARVADGDTTSIGGSGWQRTRPADPHTDSRPDSEQKRYNPQELEHPSAPFFSSMCGEPAPSPNPGVQLTSPLLPQARTIRPQPALSCLQCHSS